MGILYIVATPIGNLKDITLRGAEILSKVAVVVCEDTRRTGKLLEFVRDLIPVGENYQRPELISMTDYNERLKCRSLIERLNRGADIALVSDSGSPLFSDPGFHLVRAALEAGIKVESIPGASAIIPAVQVSGLSSDRVLFWGFLPKKRSDKAKVFEKFKQISSVEALTAVFFESPFRVRETLEILAENFPDSRLAVVKELTKLHEEIVRGNAKEVFEKFPAKTLGEVVLVLRLID